MRSVAHVVPGRPRAPASGSAVVRRGRALATGRHHSLLTVRPTSCLAAPTPAHRGRVDARRRRGARRLRRPPAMASASSPLAVARCGDRWRARGARDRQDRVWSRARCRGSRSDLADAGARGARARLCWRRDRSPAAPSLRRCAPASGRGSRCAAAGRRRGDRMRRGVLSPTATAARRSSRHGSASYASSAATWASSCNWRCCGEPRSPGACATSAARCCDIFARGRLARGSDPRLAARGSAGTGSSSSAAPSATRGCGWFGGSRTARRPSRRPRTAPPTSATARRSARLAPGAARAELRPAAREGRRADERAGRRPAELALL